MNSSPHYNRQKLKEVYSYTTHFKFGTGGGRESSGPSSSPQWPQPPLLIWGGWGIPGNQTCLQKNCENGTDKKTTHFSLMHSLNAHFGDIQRYITISFSQNRSKSPSADAYPITLPHFQI
jgi:hypothetical protein